MVIERLVFNHLPNRLQNKQSYWEKVRKPGSLLVDKSQEEAANETRLASFIFQNEIYRLV